MVKGEKCVVCGKAMRRSNNMVNGKYTHTKCSKPVEVKTTDNMEPQRIHPSNN